MLDLLDEAEYIAPDITGARLGQIFLIQGVLRFMDYRLLKDCWEYIAPITIQGAQTKGGPLKQADRANMQNLFKLVQKLPHSVELIVHSGDRMVWTCPNPENLLISPETLTFSHGSSIPGTWSMVATLDGLPASEGDQFMTDIAADMAAKPMVKELQTAFETIVVALRSLLGRPFRAYAATPLIIFRKVEPRQLDI